jgi:hypothetical protein
MGSFDFSGLGLTIPRIAGALTAGSWLLQIAATRPRIRWQGHMLPLAGFLAAIALSVATRPDRTQSMIGAYLVFVGVLLYLLVATLPRTRKELFFVVAAIWSVGLVSSTIGFVQYLAPGFEVLQTTEGGLDVAEGAVVDEDSVSSGPIRRVTGGLGDANQLAFTLVTLAPLAIFWWRLPEARKLRPFVLAILLVQCGALALTYSRSGMISIAAAVLLLTWKRRLPASVVLPAGALAAVLAVIALPGFGERIFSISYLKEGSTQIRKDILGDTLAIIRENWITGIGYGELGPRIYGEPRSEYAQEMADQIDLDSPEIHNTGAHNLLLEVWVEYGIIGLIPYAIFLITLLWEVNRISNSPDPVIADLGVAVLAGLTAFLVCGIFGHGKALKVFWLLAGVAACVGYLEHSSSGEHSGTALSPAAAVR